MPQSPTGKDGGTERRDFTLTCPKLLFVFGPEKKRASECESGWQFNSINDGLTFGFELTFPTLINSVGNLKPKLKWILELKFKPKFKPTFFLLNCHPGATEEGHFLSLSLYLPLPLSSLHAKKCFRSFLLEGYLNMNRGGRERGREGGRRPRQAEGPFCGQVVTLLLTANENTSLSLCGQ